MKRCFWLLVWLLGLNVAYSSAENVADSVLLQVYQGDTFYLARLHDVFVYPQLHFTSARQERFYWRTVRDVKKTLPLAHQLTREMLYADTQMALLPTKKEQKYWWKQFEKQLYKRYEHQFRNMTASQGRMLMLLLDRESAQTGYQIIYRYKGKFTADFWQLVARIFKNDLKENYDANDKDHITERIITLVEAGQL